MELRDKNINCVIRSLAICYGTRPWLVWAVVYVVTFAQTLLSTREGSPSKWGCICTPPTYLPWIRHWPSLVVDRGPMLRMLGWALTRMCDNRCYYSAVEKNAGERLCVEQSYELFSNIRGRGGASNACFHS